MKGLYETIISTACSLRPREAATRSLCPFTRMIIVNETYVPLQATLNTVSDAVSAYMVKMNDHQ